MSAQFDQQAFIRFIADTKPAALAAIRRHLPARYASAIDDAAQETYLRVFRAWPKLDRQDMRRASNWVYTVAKHESLRLCQRLDREARKADRLFASGADLTRVDTPFFENSERDDARLRDAVRKLPVRYRELFSAILAGETESEYAARLGLAPGTVRSRAHRGKILLARLLGDEHYEQR